MSPEEPHTYADVDVELVTAALAQHHIDFRRTDAMGNNPCVCDEWWDSVAMPGWDEHMAEVAVAALAAEGRLRTAAGHRTPFAGLLGVRTFDGRVYAPEDVVFIYLPADPPTSGDDTMTTDLRPSVRGTYDSRETGPRYHVTPTIDGRVVGAFRAPIPDPFVRTTVEVRNWRDLLRGLLRRRLVVEVTVGADPELMYDVLELDENALIAGRTRKAAFHQSMSVKLSDHLAEETTP